MKTNSLVKFIFTKEYFSLLTLAFIWMYVRGHYFYNEPTRWSTTGIFITLILAPVFEEFAFRGYMLNRLNACRGIGQLNWHGVGLANFLVSFVFTATHYDVWSSLVWFATWQGQIVWLDYMQLITRLLGLIICSLFYGRVYEKYKLLRFSIFMHFSVNFFGLFNYIG